jgi:hypothetical protein
MNTKQQHQAGSALVTVMIIIFIISLTAGGFYSFSASMLRQSETMTDAVRARAIAEAGANQAVRRLLDDFDERDTMDGEETAFGGGSYVISVDNDDERSALSVEGRYGDASAVVGVALRDANQSNLPEWSEYSMFTDGQIRLSGTPTINASATLHANMNFIVNGNWNSIDGAISAANESDIAAMLPSSQVIPWEVKPFPTLDSAHFQLLRAAAVASGELEEIFGDKVYKKNQAPTKELTIVHGNVTFQSAGTRNINGILYVTGNIRANGSSTFNIWGTMMADGEIDFNGASGTFDYRTNAYEKIVGPSSGSNEVEVTGWWLGGG